MNAMKSGVQRKLLHAFCEVLPRLNAMKSGVQPLLRGILKVGVGCLNAMKSGVQRRKRSYAVSRRKRFECDEERSATCIDM